MDLKLIPAQEKDIPEIAELAAVIWNQHYPSIISRDQIDYMLKMMYSAESLSEQISKKRHLFYFIQKDKKNSGFISVVKESGNDWFLNKFYIDQTTASTGIGTKAFQLLLNEITPEKITLTVNRKNFKSINFYFKNGFTIQEVKDFDIGNGYLMEDFIMVWKSK